MSEIKHWLDESSDANDFERAILRSGSMADPTDAKRDEVWTNVLGALAMAPALVPAAGTSAAKAVLGGAGKTAAVWLSVGKGFIVGLAIYGAASGVSEIAEHFSARPMLSTAHSAALVPRPQRAPEVAAPATPPAVPFATVEPAPTASPSAASVLNVPANALGNAAAQPVASSRIGELPSVAAFEPVGPALAASAVRESQLKAEAASLSSAREALRAGRLTDAFAQLEASRRQFSAPELYQEREALTIELLSRSGQPAVAQQRAEAFLKRFPESPHADQVRRFATH